MDVEILSRLQFAGTIMFHYLFPPLSIGLGLQLFLCELAYFRTQNPAWEAAARFWTRVFAVNFAMGVATGIVMEFEFGTNWAAYSRFVGDVFGSALAAEGIFAFFLESGFLAVLVFGWDRVGPKMHLVQHVDGVSRFRVQCGLDRGRQQLATNAGGLPHRLARRAGRNDASGRSDRLLGDGVQSIVGRSTDAHADRCARSWSLLCGVGLLVLFAEETTRSRLRSDVFRSPFPRHCFSRCSRP